MSDWSQSLIPQMRQDELDHIAGQWSPDAIRSMTHIPEQSNPVRNFIDYAQQPAPPQQPPPWQEKINQALTRQDPRYIPAEAPQQQNWQRWLEQALNYIPFGGIGAVKPWTAMEVATLQRMMKTGRFEQIPGKTNASILAKMDELASTPLRPERGGYVRKPGSPTIASNQEKVNQLLQLMAKNNMTQPQMAEVLGVSERSLRRYMSENLNVRQRRVDILKDANRIQQYKDMVAGGWTQDQMAQKLGTHVGNVSNQLAILRRAGLIDYTPQGGTRTPSMPSFNFQKKESSIGDPEFEKTVADFMALMK